MSSELVPFGKHKGQPVEVLLADTGYREWVLAQPWVKDRYPTFHQTIINVGGEPAETPEHNQLQASFLDNGRCLALSRLLLPAALFNGVDANRVLQRAAGRIDSPYSSYGSRKTHVELLEEFQQHLWARRGVAAIHSRQFEVDGWDVVYKVNPVALWLELTSMPACPCVCDHERDCPEDSRCRGGGGSYCRHPHEGRFAPTFEWWESTSEDEKHDAVREFHAYDHCHPDCPFRDDTVAGWLLEDEERFYQSRSRTVRVECKPDLGDDFPAVLRQVTRYPAGDRDDSRCVVVRRHAFEHVTWDQVTEMFRASGITLLSEQRLATEEDA